MPACILITIGHGREPTELRALPPNVHVTNWIPQAAVARHAAAIVCHGGYGTTVSALAHGLPLVIVPLFADQPHNAQRAADIGAGITLPAFRSVQSAMQDAPSALEALPAAVQTVLDDPSYAHAARRVADSVRRLAPVDTAALELCALA